MRKSLALAALVATSIGCKPRVEGSALRDDTAGPSAQVDPLLDALAQVEVATAQAAEAYAVNLEGARDRAYALNDDDSPEEIKKRLDRVEKQLRIVLANMDDRDGNVAKVGELMAKLAELNAALEKKTLQKNSAEAERLAAAERRAAELERQLAAKTAALLDAERRLADAQRYNVAGVDASFLPCTIATKSESAIRDEAIRSAFDSPGRGWATLMHWKVTTVSLNDDTTAHRSTLSGGYHSSKSKAVDAAVEEHRKSMSKGACPGDLAAKLKRIAAAGGGTNLKCYQYDTPDASDATSDKPTAATAFWYAKPSTSARRKNVMGWRGRSSASMK